MQAALARAGGAEAALGAALLTLVHHLHEPAEACPAPMADGLAHLSKRYRLHAHARHANAAGTKYPLLETLIFGDDSGATTLQYNMNGGP